MRPRTGKGIRWRSAVGREVGWLCVTLALNFRATRASFTYSIDDPELATYLRIEERELETGGLN